MSEYNSDSLQELVQELVGDRALLMRERELLAGKLREAVDLLDQIEGNGYCCHGYKMHENDCPVLLFNRQMRRWGGWETKVNHSE